MLEIAMLVIFCGKIGKIVESKGRKKIGYQFMLVGIWFGAEIFGAILGGIIGAIALEDENSATLLIIACAYGCAILGAVIAFQIAKHLQPLSGDDDFYGDIEYADRLQARERFGDRSAAPPAVTDGYTDNPEKVRRPLDDRVQE
ncbi:MAG TPA: hypothetical protein VN688_21230 [Gemmataceae bacterium]|nr:hypothetical protein [Gemmataceae bacterium]